MSKTVTTIDQRLSVALPPEALDALGVEAGAEGGRDCRPSFGGSLGGGSQTFTRIHECLPINPL